MASSKPAASARRRGFIEGLLCGIAISCLVFQFAQRGWLMSLTTVATSLDKIVAAKPSSSLTGPKIPSDTTIIVTSSLIPSHPSVVIINHTIQSVYKHIRGLDFPTTKLIIVIDGRKNNGRQNDGRKEDVEYERYGEMVNNLRGNFTNATILPRGEWIGLSRLVKRAMQEVSTKYVYLLQHDLMFVEDIDHKAMTQAMEDYPDELQIVRFNLRMNQKVGSDNLTSCYARPSVLDNVNGISFTRAGAWSDNNQFATKAYYHTLFTEYLNNSNPRHPMEWRMGHLVANNCSLAPFLYGAVRQGPYLRHLDGRFTQLSDLSPRQEFDSN